MSDAKISVIIPTLNEAGSIEQSISSISTSQDIEIIIVDGGSLDNTVEIAQSLNLKVLTATGGRAIQMNIGAELATGEILLFLHADTILPPNFATMVRLVLASREPAPIAGAFKLRIDAPQWRLRLVEWGVNCRSTLAQMPYGDQAIFLTAKTFQQLGGFLELPIMEDFELIRQLKRLGRIELISTPVITSPRRWLNKGILQTTIINQIMVIAYLLGVSPIQLSHWYRGRKHLNQQKL